MDTSRPTGRQRFARGAGLMAGVVVGVAVVASSVTAIVYNLSQRSSSRHAEPQKTTEDLRAEKAKLAADLKNDLLADPPQPVQDPRWTLAQVERRRPLVRRLQDIAAKLGEPTDKLDDLARMLNDLEDLARRRLAGER